MYAVGEQDDHDDIFPVIEYEGAEGCWEAPADLERRLYKLAQVEESYTYLRTLAEHGVYHPVPIEHANRNPAERQPLTSRITGSDGVPRTITQVYTDGLLPRPHPYVVFEFITLGTLAHILPPEVDVLVVNAATPCQEMFQVDDEEREVWEELHEELFDPQALTDRLVTRRTGAPEPGPLLHGLACGAHLCYGNGDPWNTLDWHGAGYSAEVERLEESWGISSREDWLETQQRLLECEVSPWFWDFVLGARQALDRERGVSGGRGPVDAGLWRDCVESTLRRAVEAPEGPQFEQFLAEMRGMVGKILRYEARFRADGLLGSDEVVRTVAAWDLGRASKMARWGRGARYATRAEMYDAVERVSAGVRSNYRSWAEFSAAYVMGRCLHFDEERFGEWYTEVLEAHHALLRAPASPWNTVPFQLPG
ncbi:DUF1266 domain-containing protein [Streptomyces sp. 891-h]|uniref:DUF1266 domain-containing protein n=1 Tax=Streptomyces sp. 891-h TaxID=2720714 RepID=UPI001FA9E7EF|nr:DUF1266 domain-containing protein [Streptomyces sp. 891-h]UNZ16575.1 DUF1266 domain-containing protein [Streptomyces sp. 891-h]